MLIEIMELRAIRNHVVLSRPRVHPVRLGIAPELWTDKARRHRIEANMRICSGFFVARIYVVDYELDSWPIVIHSYSL